MQFVEVVWDDAWHDMENFASIHGITLTHKPMVVRTKGWLICDDAAGVSIANEDSVTEDGVVYRGRTFIPRAMITSIGPWPSRRSRKTVVSPSAPRADTPEH